MCGASLAHPPIPNPADEICAAALLVRNGFKQLFKFWSGWFVGEKHPPRALPRPARRGSEPLLDLTEIAKIWRP